MLKTRPISILIMGRRFSYKSRKPQEWIPESKEEFLLRRQEYKILGIEIESITP